jgi:hypothetical protein
MTPPESARYKNPPDPNVLIHNAAARLLNTCIHRDSGVDLVGNDAIEDRLVDQAAIEVVEKTRGRQWRPNYKPAVLTTNLP